MKAVLTEKSGAGDNMAEIFHLGSSKGTLLQVDGKTMKVAKIQHTVMLPKGKGRIIQFTYS